MNISLRERLESDIHLYLYYFTKRGNMITNHLSDIYIYVYMYKNSVCYKKVKVQLQTGRRRNLLPRPLL